VRQVEILSLAAKGQTDSQMAVRLRTTEDAIRWEVRKIRSKFDAPDRASAVDQGWRRGYLGMWTVGIDWTTRRSDHPLSTVGNRLR
jgi:DNA-binding NarL/FixJ family response regulator